MLWKTNKATTPNDNSRRIHQQTLMERRASTSGCLLVIPGNNTSDVIWKRKNGRIRLAASPLNNSARLTLLAQVHTQPKSSGALSDVTCYDECATSPHCCSYLNITNMKFGNRIHLKICDIFSIVLTCSSSSKLLALI